MTVNEVKEPLNTPLAGPGADLKLLIGSDIEEPWFKSVARSIREKFNPPKLAPLEITSKPVEGATLGGMTGLELPWYKSLIANVRELINPPKLPPLEVTSKPVEVGTIWGAYKGGESKSGAVSLLIHVGVIALLLLIFQTPQAKNILKKAVDIYYVPPYKPKLPPAAQKSGGGGGGGMHDPKPVSRGVAPPQAPKTFVPPTFAVEKPKLAVVPTITAPAPQIEAPDYGDPLSKLNAQSGGPGSQGFGTGKGGGIGSGNGDGFGPGNGGGTGGGAYRIGGEVSAPQLVSKVEPEYSEEARKAKFSGSVLLSIVVDANGMPRDVKVIRPLGLGLDEKAIEAVMRWRFKPGMRHGQAVSTQANVEVNFRLL